MLLQLAGFLLHDRKSVQQPTQKIEYLGFLIDSRTMTISLPPEKSNRLAKAILRAIKLLRSKRSTTVREAARLIGLIVSATTASKYGKAHYRTLENAKLQALQSNGFNFSGNFVWPEECLPDLQWWLTEARNCSTSFVTPQPTTTVITDASLEGWGATWAGDPIYGGWEKDEQRIDELELRAVLAALETLPVVQEHRTIDIRCDNTVAVAYLNHMGGRIPRLDNITRKIWRLLEAHGSFIIATYIPTDENPADALTRGIVSKAQVRDFEVKLNPSIFQSFAVSGPFKPVIDWFASSSNAQLKRFYTWSEVSTSAAEGYDAFGFFWGHEVGYMFPPFALIPRILSKVIKDKARVLLVHPRWPGALWAPTLNEITVMRRNLEQSANVLQYPENPGLRHPMTDLRLAVSWIDGRSTTRPFGTRCTPTSPRQR
jgi:hypothetical protein